MNKLLEKYNGFSVKLKATFWFFVCNILQKGISFITVPIFTRLLSTEQYGQYSIYLSWFELILKFTSMNLYLGVFNNAMLKYKEHDRDKFISAIQGLCFTLELGVFAVYLLFTSKINELLDMSTMVILLMFAQLLVSPCIQFWSTRLRFEYKYRPIIIVTLVQSLFNPILGIILVRASEDKGVARIVSVVVVEVIVGGSIMIYHYIKGRTFFDREIWKYAFFFNLPLVPHYLSSTILNHGDRIMISKMVGDSEAGIYSVAYSIGMLMQLVTNAINATYTPWFYQKMEKKGHKEIKEMTNLLLLIMAIMSVTAMLFAPEMVLIFGSHEYIEAIYIVPPVSASVFFIFTYNIMIYSEYYFEENKLIMYASLFAAILNIILNYVFIGMFGYLAAGYTTLVSYIFLALAHYLLSRRACKKHYEGIHIFDKKFIVILSAIVSIVAIFVNVLFDYIIVRYLIIIAIVALGIYKRSFLLEKFKILKSSKNEKKK